MISAMPAVAVRREREKNRQGKLVGDPFGRGVAYLPGHHLHHFHPPSYYHHHHHNSSTNHHQGSNKSTKSSTTKTRDSTNNGSVNNGEKSGLRFLVYTASGCLVIGLISLLVGIVTIKLATQIIGLVFIGLGGLFCVIKVILNSKSPSTPSPSSMESCQSNGNGNTATTTGNVNNCNSLATVNQPYSAVDSKQPSRQANVKSKPDDCLNQVQSSIDQQYLEAS